MAIVRLKEVGPQSMTLTTDAHESSVTMYAFLKSSASSTDRAIAMREFKRHAARHNESGHSGPLSLLYHGNGRMVALCEEAVHDVLLRTAGSSSHATASPNRVDGAASRRRTMHERNPSIALEKDTWRHFLLHAAPKSPSLSQHQQANGAVVQAEEVQRIGASAQRQSIEDHIRALLTEQSVDGDDGDARIEAHQRVQQGHLSSKRGSERSPSVDARDHQGGHTHASDPSPPRGSSAAPYATEASPQTAASPPELRIESHTAASATPHRVAPVPQPILHVMEDAADVFGSNPTASNAVDQEELAAASGIEGRIVELQTRLKAVQGNANHGSASPKRSQFVVQLLDRLHNVQQLHAVQRHEQDTLDLTANALRTENAALTKMLRALLAVMTRAELRLEQRGHATTEVEAAEGMLLSELHSILDDAADVSQERSQ